METPPRHGTKVPDGNSKNGPSAFIAKAFIAIFIPFGFIAYFALPLYLGPIALI